MFRDIQIVIITNFVVVSSVGIKRVDCICMQRRLKSVCASSQFNQNLRCAHKETLNPWLAKIRRMNIPTRLYEYAGWSVYSSDARVFFFLFFLGGTLRLIFFFGGLFILFYFSCLFIYLLLFFVLFLRFRYASTVRSTSFSRSPFAWRFTRRRNLQTFAMV